MVSGQLLKMFKVQPARVLPEFLLEGAPALFFYRFFAFEEDKVGRPTAVPCAFKEVTWGPLST